VIQLKTAVTCQYGEKEIRKRKGKRRTNQDTEKSNNYIKNALRIQVALDKNSLLKISNIRANECCNVQNCKYLKLEYHLS